MERHRASERDAPPFGPVGLLARSLTELVDEARLADPGLADEEDNLTAPRACALEAFLELAHLAVTAHERRQASLALHVEPGARGPRRDDFPGLDGLALALEPELRHGARLAVSGDQPMDGLRNEDLPRRRGLLEPRRDVGGVADGGVV